MIRPDPAKPLMTERLVIRRKPARNIGAIIILACLVIFLAGLFLAGLSINGSARLSEYGLSVAVIGGFACIAALFFVSKQYHEGE